MLGKVKTRLASAIGNVDALRVHEALVKETIAKIKPCDCDKVVYFSDEHDATGIFSTVGFRQEIQYGVNLGERMKHAFAKEFSNGYSSIVIIGTDCPEMDHMSISLAFEQLEVKDVVLGPAHDGGYYLMGLSALHTQLFEDIPWSTSAVFKYTVDRVSGLSLSLGLTAKKQDIDTLDDLKMSAFGKAHFPELVC
jgi:rSAM/selenodomain-associated transferase 1